MNIFKDIELQKKFERDGFVKISLADEHIVQSLGALYKEVQPESYKGFSSTIYNPDIDLKINTSQKIFDLLKGAVEKQFENFRPLGCSFLCKTSGHESFLPVHQDWTIVDESKFFSATIWMPLVDTNEQNGVLKVLSGSHHFSDVLRSPTLPGVFQKISNEIYARMEPVPVKVGEAIVINHALLHASPANLSGKDRVVATFGLVPQEAQLCFYHRTEKGFVEKYKTKDDFFLTYNDIGSVPKLGEKIEEFNYTWKEWSTINLNVAIEMAKQKSKAANMKRLFTDDKTQEFFNKNGFVKLRILDEADVKILHDYYYQEELNEHAGTGFSYSIDNKDKEKVARVRDRLYEVILPKAMKYFDYGKVIVASYVVKDYNPLCIVPPHQDWTFADNEGENYSVNCWIPLVDTTLQNGAIGVIKGSHLMLNDVRSSPSPHVPTPLMDYQFSIFPYLEMIEMKAGEAVVFDNRTFHASTPNTTNTPRIAIGLGFTQKDAKICHYNMKANGKKDTLLKYFVDEDFFLKYDNSLLAKMYDTNESIKRYEIAEEIPFVLNTPKLDELVAMMKQAGNNLNPELNSYMAKLFGYDTTKEESPPIVEEQKSIEISNETISENKPYKGSYAPMNILREIKLRLVGY